MNDDKKRDSRRVVCIKGHPGIYRIEVYDREKKKWTTLKRGAKFQAVKPSHLTGTGKPLKRNFDDFREASEWKHTRESKVANTKFFLGQSPDESKTFGDLAGLWQRDWLPHREESTQVRYQSYLKHFQYFWNMPIEMIEPVHIDGWITYLKRPEYLKACHATRCGYEHEFSVLRIILNFYRSRFNRNFHLPFLPDHKPMLKVKEKPKLVKDLTVEEFKAFILALKNIVFGTKWEVIYFMALMQYAIFGRVQDAAALHYEDFNFERDKLNVNKKVQWVRAKGREDKIVSGSKTDGGKELATIPDLAAKVFKEWVLRSGVRSGLLFKLDGQIVKYRTISYYYDKALKAAAIPFRGTHILRHASLTEHYDTCKDILATAKMAGHSDLRATERYTKIRDERVKETQRALDAKLESVF